MGHGHGIKFNEDIWKTPYLGPKHQWHTFRMWHGLTVMCMTKAKRFYLTINPEWVSHGCDVTTKKATEILDCIKLNLVYDLPIDVQVSSDGPNRNRSCLNTIEKISSPSSLKPSIVLLIQSGVVPAYESCLWLHSSIHPSSGDLSIHAPLTCCINYRGFVLCYYLIELISPHNSAFSLSFFISFFIEKIFDGVDDL